MIEFANPWVFLSLPLIWFCRWRCLVNITTLRVSNINLLNQAIGRKRYLEDWLSWIIIFLIIIALANPIKQKSIILNDTKGYSIALLLDASYSMREDNRFKIAKDVLKDFIKRRKDDRLGLEVFGDSARLASPMSYDKGGLELILRYLRAGVAGGRDTALYEALFLGTKLFKKEPKNNRVMILLTDGIDTVGDIPLSVALTQIKKEKIRVYTIGVGDDFRRNILKKIAKESGGAFFSASNPKELSTIYSKIDTLQKQKIETKHYKKILSYYRLPLALALIFLIWLLLIKLFRRENYLYVALTLFFSLLAFKGWEYQDRVSINKNKGELYIALEASNSMRARDIYPNRLLFAIHKVKTLIDNLDGVRIGVVIFSKRPWLLSLATNDYSSLKKLLDGVDFTDIDKKDTNSKALLRGLDKIKDLNRSSTLVIFGDGDRFNNISYIRDTLKKQNWRLFCVGTATNRGSTIPTDNGLLRDMKGDVIITRLNPNFLKIAKDKRSFIANIGSDNDMKNLAKSIKSSIVDDKIEFSISSTKRDFWFPLLLALLIFISPWQRLKGLIK